MVTRNGKPLGAFNCDVGVLLPALGQGQALGAYFMDGDELRRYRPAGDPVLAFRTVQQQNDRRDGHGRLVEVGYARVQRWAGGIGDCLVINRGRPGVGTALNARASVRPAQGRL